ncbi:CD3324 family protein [Clostridium intestinale]|uniref:CD3324 family protein n=1 Tax=Clostridium intestinale TaxID=36845 RepID=UPI002DD6630B|nr:CD3324 family protein [Clostridium intestinale]WRY53307.1 CD3324 family protein [Clostridium intestinale]
MKYEKAQNILPEELVEIIQQYIDGSYLYIPRKVENKKAWGENSGVKRDLRDRNEEIFSFYNRGMSVRSLTEKYYLSEQTIRRIIREEKSNI